MLLAILPLVNNSMEIAAMTKGMMAKGITITWHDENDLIEVEHFYGIDVGNLGCIPEFDTVTAYWPHYKQVVEYHIDARCERKSSREVHLIVTYDKAQNRELSEKHPDGGILWGINTVILKQGKQQGDCKWLGSDQETPTTIPWKAFDLEASGHRPIAKYLVSKRQADFRNMILAHDGQCVLTEEEIGRAHV